MTIRIEDGIALLEGACGVEDAEPLFAALAAGRVEAADLSRCEAAHGAVVQALLRFRVAPRGASTNPFLRDLVAPALARAALNQRRRAGGDVHLDC